MNTFSEHTALMEPTLHSLTDALNTFVAACMGVDGKPKSPGRQAWMDARDSLSSHSVDTSGIGPSLTDDQRLMAHALRLVAQHFKTFLTACLDAHDGVVAPPMKALMQARACLPSRCSSAFVPKTKG